MSTVLFKKKPSKPLEFEKKQGVYADDIFSKSRKDKAYKNEPHQFPIIIADILDIRFPSQLDKSEFKKQCFKTCTDLMNLLEKCEFYEFKEGQFTVFMQALRATPFCDFEKTTVKNRNINETTGEKSLEAPCEIFHRLGEAEDFESTRTLISNGALRRWLLVQQAKEKSDDTDQSINEIPEIEPNE